MGFVVDLVGDRMEPRALCVLGKHSAIDHISSLENLLHGRVFTSKSSLRVELSKGALEQVL